MLMFSSLWFGHMKKKKSPMNYPERLQQGGMEENFKYRIGVQPVAYKYKEGFFFPVQIL